jgi:hypothetical protein
LVGAGLLCHLLDCLGPLRLGHALGGVPAARAGVGDGGVLGALEDAGAPRADLDAEEEGVVEADPQDGAVDFDLALVGHTLRVKVVVQAEGDVPPCREGAEDDEPLGVVDLGVGWGGVWEGGVGYEVSGSGGSCR